MKKGKNDTKTDIWKKLTSLKTLIKRGFRETKNYIIRNKRPVLLELNILLIFGLIIVIGITFVDNQNLKREIEHVNKEYIILHDQYETDEALYIEALENSDLEIQELNELNEKLESDNKKLNKEVDDLKVFVKEVQSELDKTKERLKNVPKQTSRGRGVAAQTEWMTFTATAYTKDCYKCSGITAGGTNLHNLNHTPNLIAADPNVLPLGTMVEIKGIGVYKVDDTGGRIINRKIDILHPSKTEAFEFGRQQVQLRIVK